jgi:3-isopropylmalate dehydrogenase
VLKVGILLGDDIGLEVVPEAVKVMKAAAKKTGLDVEWQDLPIGKRGHELHGYTMPPSTVAALEGMDGFLCGPIGHAAYPRNDPTWVMPPVRKRFQLFASIKPVKSTGDLGGKASTIDIDDRDGRRSSRGGLTRFGSATVLESHPDPFVRSCHGR